MSQEINTLAEVPEEYPSGERLDSWKQIASHLNCSERTVRRWEEEGLPVHRHPHKKKAAIYAYKAELDAWWHNGHERLKQIEEAKEEALEQRTMVTGPWWRRPWPIAGLGLAALVLFVAGLMAGRFRESILGKTPTAPIHSVAVLPLENLSRDPEQEYFANGMTDALITDLAKIHALRVISRNSIMVYQGKPKPLPQIAHELNVDAVVEGTVVTSGGRVRITAQLIEAPQDRHLWAETYEGNVRDVLSLQDQIARAIASAVRTTLTPQEQTQLSSARPVDPSAHEAYLRGLYELQLQTAEARVKAIWHFEQALARDPNDALAYSGLADAYRSQSPYERAPLEVMPQAKVAALKAIQLDDSLAEAHAALGSIKLSFDWDWPGAESEIRRALELNPNLPAAHALYGQYLLVVPHHMEEAIQEIQRANDLDPLIPSARESLAWSLFEVRRYSECVETAKSVQGDDSTAALCYAKLGQNDETLAAADRALQSSSNPVIMARTATAYAMVGSKDKSTLLLGQILKQASQRYVCGLNIASIYANLGDDEQAFAWLDRAYLQRSD